ncbi:riboflavin synthase, alpha subunit [Ruminiclostridium papyrosolvens DSM 2782]|uniref:Riboflavin synthase n=1 Tax=Ruminiclostridium papyrosolvens DSM 2782 TaxID=588581 RepID=F1TAB1_9FIRM|nr:riboflavin synthase [Ruminiclostridium papyrosolvens]EGD48454.1 riboflavin synthase, alpha subunit [Ruminiclostridium papyrosolvens DSM 2782]WES32788.1 riboflavin synthase [Ruminiclostridium papyrosolvens DSM 2782]
MFTGIVEEMGSVKNIVYGSSSIKLSIECTTVIEGTVKGDSIAVNGICLTVTELGGNWFTADVMPETMRKTGLEKLKPGKKVNLERALRLADRLGGHIVSGHIDGTGIITELKKEDNAVLITITAPEQIMKYIVQKGSVSLDGTSLTIAELTSSTFTVSLIPLTRGFTILGSKSIGDRVNIECDIIGKYVEKMLKGEPLESEPSRSNLSAEFLREHGFM